MAQLATAAVIMPDGFGDVLITTSNSGANSVLVPVGQPVAFAPYEIRFDPNASLTPAGAASINIQDVVATYVVNMGAGSSINGGANDGITSAAASLTVNADGTIAGANGISGVAPGTLTVVNNSTITGTAGAGINSTGTVSLTNSWVFPIGASRILGSTNGVVGLGAGSVVNNFGVITGSNGDGVTVGDNGNVSNSLTTLGFFGNLFGGQITGSNNGVVAGNNLTLVNQDLGNITGTTFDGIAAGNTATITNDLGARIIGQINGVSVGTGAQITNNGSVTGTIGRGISAAGGGNTVITNGGIITAGSQGIWVNNVAPGDIINNTGTINSAASGVFFLGGTGGVLTNSGTINSTAGSSFIGNLQDTVNLNFGSRMIGAVNGFVANDGDVLNFGAGLTTPGGVGNSISGNVTSFNTINKNLGGVALIGLPGESFLVNANDININSGGLYINANIFADDGVGKATIAASGAAVGGTGIWNANLNVTGTGGFSAGSIPINLDVNPANAVGTVNLTGNVTHTPTTFIRYDYVPQGGPTDAIVQTGVGNTYDIGGGFVRLSSTNNDLALRNGTYVVVQSDENIVGAAQLRPNVQFNANVPDTGIVGNQAVIGGGNNPNTVLGSQFSTITVVGKQILLNVAHNFQGLGTNPNAAAFGQALDNSVNAAGTQDFISALDNSDLATVQATLNGASPDATFGTAVALVSGNNRLNRLVSDHLALTRAGGDSVRYNVGSYSEPAPAPQVQNAGIGNVWGTASYDWKNIDGNFANDFDGEEASFTAGVDYRVSPNLLIGILLDGSTANYDYTGGGSDVDSFRVAIYGTYGQPTGLYADFLAGYGSHSMDLSRNGGLLGGINSSTDADSIQAMLTVGYAMQSGCIKHGPFAGIEYQNINVDGYTQGGVLPIGVSGYDVDSLRLLAGYRVEAAYGKFSPFASVAYAHEFEDDQLSTTAVLPGGAGFGVTGSGLDSAILISIGANYSLTENLTLTGGYHGEIAVGGDGADSHGASLGLNYAF